MDHTEWIVQARYADGAPAFWGRMPTLATAEAWRQEQIDAHDSVQIRYNFDAPVIATRLGAQKGERSSVPIGALCDAGQGAQLEVL